MRPSITPRILCLSLLSLFIFTLSNSGYSQNYTTINDGDWTNTSNVWSTNGTTACGCSPSSTINGFNVTVNHDIIMDVDIYITGSTDTLLINSSGGLSEITKLINVTNGYMRSEDSAVLNIKEFIVGVGAQADLLSDITVQVKWAIDGTVNLYAASTVIDENLEVKSTGTLNLHTGSSLVLENKDLLIDGTLTVNSACITVDVGNVENKGGATVSGFGLITAVVGNISNSGTWDVNTLWCAGGSDSGMPTPEDCTTTCLSVLPVELYGLEVKSINNEVRINWFTAGEMNNKFFIVERSNNGEIFDEFLKVEGAGFSTNILAYEAFDKKPTAGINYYRISQMDYNGTTSYSYVVSINFTGMSKINAFPNPVHNGKLNIELSNTTLRTNNISLNIYNYLGELVLSKDVTVKEGILNTTLNIEHLSPGTYFISGEDYSNNKTEVFVIQIK